MISPAAIFAGSEGGMKEIAISRRIRHTALEIYGGAFIKIVMMHDAAPMSLV